MDSKYIDIIYKELSARMTYGLKVQVNDEIEFSCLDGNEAAFVVRVIALHRFENFADLYANLPLLKCGYTSETISNATPDDMNQYYSIEEQSQHGVIGIEIEHI